MRTGADTVPGSRPVRGSGPALRPVASRRDEASGLLCPCVGASATLATRRPSRFPRDSSLLPFVVPRLVGSTDRPRPPHRACPCPVAAPEPQWHLRGGANPSVSVFNLAVAVR